MNKGTYIVSTYSGLCNASGMAVAGKLNRGEPCRNHFAVISLENIWGVNMILVPLRFHPNHKHRRHYGSMFKHDNIDVIFIWLEVL